MQPLRSRDFWAGLLFFGAGVGALGMARGYPAGTVLRMGPGYLPRMLGVILILFGLAIMIMGFRHHRPIEGAWSWRALVLLPLSMIAFGLLVERAGFVPAMGALVFGSAAAGREFKLVEVLWLTGVLTALSLVVFVWLLGLPHPLFKGF